MSATANLAARLAETIGAQRVVAAPEERMAYAMDGLVPGAIARPAAAEEAAEVVRFAVAEKLAIHPFGSRSKCEIGMPATRYDIALDMTGLREIAHYDAGDMTLSVDAGMPLRDLEIYLKEKAQFLPLAVPCFESATAGGAIASGIDSALRRKYGPARDFLIGAEFVDGTGQICKSGGRVVKNVTGYDLHKLLIGSLGTLGAITRLNFRTFPLPTASGGHVANFSSSQGALSYTSAVEKAALPLADLEMLSPKVMRMIRAILQKAEEGLPSGLERDEWCVYSSFEGNPETVQRISRDLERIAREAGALRNGMLETAEDESLGGMLRESFEWLRWGSPANAIYRLALPELTAQILEELSRLADSVSLDAAFLVRSAGVLYFTVFDESEDEAAIAALTKIAGGVTSLARARKGHATLLHAPLAVKANTAQLMSGELDPALQWRVKQAFDPSGVFVPGRVLGRL